MIAGGAMPDTSSPEPEVTFRTTSGGRTQVEVIVGDRTVSWLSIEPFILRMGAATVRMEGIAGVGTEEGFRHRGYARRLLEATVERMRQGDAALSMLYGIRDFYPKFGYATAGPDHRVVISELSQNLTLPGGWSARPFAVQDLLAIQRLYERGTALGAGAAVRFPEARSWSRLADPEGQGAEDCRVVVDGEGQVRAYAWRARWHWSVGFMERDEPEALVIAEVFADSPSAADAVLAACRAWADEESGKRGQPVKRILLSLPPEGPVAAAAMYQSATFLRRFGRCGGSMARVLHVGRLLQSLIPELDRRIQAAGFTFRGALHLDTEIGEATLIVTPQGVAVESSDLPPARHPIPAGTATTAHPGTAGETLIARLPQATLARLVLGAFPPEDLLARLVEPPGEKARQLLALLFPPRHPHMYLPDRF
jgi:GNAT acetyltransferase-like protein